jgi:hypothetical protein
MDENEPTRKEIYTHACGTRRDKGDSMNQESRNKNEKIIYIRGNVLVSMQREATLYNSKGVNFNSLNFLFCESEQSEKGWAFIVLDLLFKINDAM